MKKPYNNYELPYPKEEQEALAKLNTLMNEWCDAIQEKDYDFVPDGFYPYYFSQHPRVLFIARESYGFCSNEQKRGAHYLEWFYEKCHNGNVKRFPLPRRMFRIMHAILRGDAKSLHEADVTELAENFATEGHLSFAFMNLNKDSNMREKKGKSAPKTRWDDLRAFVDTYHEQIRREIAILDPDIIVTANLFNDAREQMEKIFPELETLDESGKEVDVFSTKINSRKVHILNTYHWSASQAEYCCYYECIRNACEKFHINRK